MLTTTFDLLGGDRALVIRDFVEACPPHGISWLENARQFHEFLSARWQHEAPEPPYLPDVASYELAYATVRAGQREEAAAIEAPARRRPPSPQCRAAALRLRHPTDPGGDGLVTPARSRRETLIAVAMLPGTDEPLVSELSADLFAFVEMFDQFADPAIFEDVPELDALIDRTSGARANRGASVRICIIGKFPPIQGGVSMRAPIGARTTLRHAATRFTS